MQNGFERDTEVAPGILAEAHTVVTWTKDGGVLGLILKAPAEFDGGRINAQARSRIDSREGYVYVDKLANDVEVLPGVYARAGGWIRKRFERDYRFGVYFLIRDKAQLAPSVWAEPGAAVLIQFIDSHHYRVIRITQRKEKRDIGTDVATPGDLTPFIGVRPRG